jgi:group I intron endonuclease
MKKISKDIIEQWDIIVSPGSKKYKNFACVYAIVNKLNGKIYIGGTTNLFKRIPKHKYRLNLNKHENQHLQNAYNKYGKDNFEWYIVEECTEESALDIEQKYLNEFESYINSIGYNIQKEATNRKHTPETIEKIREKRKLQKPTFLGHKHTEASKKQISESRKGTKAWNEGKRMSAEHCKKLSEAHKGQVVTEEMKRKISDTMKGRPAHNKGTKDSEETKLKKSIAQKKRWAKIRVKNRGK